MNNGSNKTSSRLMLAALAAGMVLHIDRVPPWCVAVALATLLWHWLYSLGRVRLPPAALRILIALGLLAGIAASFSTIGGLSAGTALLLVMSAAKLLETRTPRDVTVVALASLGLVLAACLDRQSLSRLPLYLGCGWLALATIAAIGGSQAAVSSWRALLTAGRALLLSLPFAALCFLLVPRLQGALWSMPNDGSAQTGLADEMSPGSISELSNSDEIAFNVRFDGAAPPEAQRYWRGPVLHDFDGYTWRRRQGASALRQQPTPLSAPVRYHVLLEPTNRPFLFGIDSVAAIEGLRHFIAFDGEVLARRPVTDVIAYDGISYMQTRVDGVLSATGRRLDTQLPAGRNLRSIALAREMRTRAGTDRQYAQSVLEYFRTAGFEYTLTPPLLNQDSVDDLIFNTRRGFCGHFASAYATLMRAAGVPARVVTGYLGATWNPVGGFYTVRQSQAHAWTEIWIEGEGWMRIDPTTVVAPERLQRGPGELLARRGSAMRSLFGEVAWLRNLRDSWEAASHWWQERIVNFNRSAQLNLLKRLGLGDIDYAGMALLLGGGAMLWGLALLAMSMRRPRGPAADALNVVWNRFIALLGKRGIAVATHEGPRAIAARAIAQWPAAATPIEDFTRRYEQLRFGTAEHSEAAIRALRRLLHRIAGATAASRRR